MLLELPGSLQPRPEKVRLPPDAANAGTGAAIAIAGTAHAIAFVTVRRLMPPVGCSSSSLIVDPPQSRPTDSQSPARSLCVLYVGERVMRGEDDSDDPRSRNTRTPDRGDVGDDTVKRGRANPDVSLTDVRRTHGEHRRRHH